MNKLYTGHDWLDRHVPGGIPFPSSTIITGPGGAGKPLIGALFSGAWLKTGGTLIHLLINFDQAYAHYLLEYFYPDVDKHANQIVYVEFDPEMDRVEKTGFHTLRANLLKAEHIDQVIGMAELILPSTLPPLLIYGTALNMLLFSKTYMRSIHDIFLTMMKDKSRSTLFTIANNIFEEQASEWEETADNLFLSHGTGIMRLSLNVLKINSTDLRNDDFEIPITEDELNQVRRKAEMARKHYIPMIRKI